MHFCLFVAKEAFNDAPRMSNWKQNYFQLKTMVHRRKSPSKNESPSFVASNLCISFLWLLANWCFLNVFHHPGLLDFQVISLTYECVQSFGVPLTCITIIMIREGYLFNRGFGWKTLPAPGFEPATFEPASSLLQSHLQRWLRHLLLVHKVGSFQVACIPGDLALPAIATVMVTGKHTHSLYIQKE